MTSKRLGIFIALSIVLHLVLLCGFQFLAPLLPKPPQKEDKKSVRVTLVQPPKPAPPPALQPSKPVPKPTQFVETSDLTKTNQPDPNTPLESDANTKASSKQAGQGETFLPNQQGVVSPALNVHTSVASIDNQGNPQPPSPKPDEKVTKEEPQQKTEPKKEPDPKTPADPKDQPQTPKVKPVDPIPLRPDAIVQVAKVEPPADPPKPAPEAPPKTQQPAQDNTPRSPPTVFSSDRKQSAIAGGAAAGSDASLASRETELGRYKAKLFRGIGSRWYLYVQQDNGLLGVGKVKIKFYVRADGVITNLEILEGKQNAQLAAISRRSIMEISGQLEPFSDSLKVQLGEGYFEEVTFSIY